ncbi:MAG: uncharacterized protein KVP18_004685 [Porospora cf. gigantea A]|uniref:uncharacterized protein n=1 Tax=Porospora cf. gigantea A TaxID=2853593 RepID=UPI00355A5BC0|nr:MAG: hypothetical protein KVP18_004685 [Porospora cf. gigantea A]
MGVSPTVLTDPTDFVLPTISSESSDRALLRNSSASLLGVDVLYIMPLTLAIAIATASRVIFCACPDSDLIRSPSFAFTRGTMAVAHWVTFVEDISVDVIDCFLMSVVLGHIVTGVDARGGTVSADVLNFFECQLTLSTFLRLVCPNRQLHRLALATFICIVVGCSLDYYITRHRDTTSLLTYLSAIPTFKSVVYWRVRVLNYDVTSRPTSTSFGSMSSVTYLSAFLWCLLLFIKDYGKDLHQKRFFSYKAGGGDPFAAVHFDNVSTPTQDKHNQSAPLFQMHLKILRGTEVNLLGGVTSGTNIVERVVSGLSPVSTGRVWWNGNQLGPAFAEVGGRQIVQGLLSSKRKVGTQLKFVLSMRRADLSPLQVDVHVGRTRVILTLFMLKHVADDEVGSLSQRDLCLFDIALSVMGAPAVVFLPPYRTRIPMILQERIDAIIAALMEYGTTFVHCEEELGLGDWYMNFLTIMEYGCVTVSGPPEHIVSPFSYSVEITMAAAQYMLPMLHRIDNAVGGLVFIVQHSRSFTAATLVFLRNDRLHERFLDVLQCLQVEFLDGRLESFIVSDTYESSFAAADLWAKSRPEYSEDTRFTHTETLRKHLSERLLHMYPRRSSLSSIMQTEEEEHSTGSSYLESGFFRQQASAMVSCMVTCQS